MWLVGKPAPFVSVRIQTPMPSVVGNVVAGKRTPSSVSKFQIPGGRGVSENTSHSTSILALVPTQTASKGVGVSGLSLTLREQARV